MSLLADLLSKRNSGAPPSSREIPPTLAEAHDVPAKVRSLKNRYVVIAAISAASIVSGLLIKSQYGRLTALVAPKTVAVVQPAKPPVPAAPPVIPPPAANPPQIIEPEQKPVVPVQKKVAKKHSGSTRSRHARRRPPAPPKLEAVSPPRSNIPAAVAQGPGGAGKIDTAKRDAYLYAARSAEQASDWRSALANYRKAQKIDPDNYVIMNNSAAALNNLAMFDDGAKEAKRALAKKPDYVPAMVNAAIAYSSKGNSQEALRLFSEATLADPGNRSLVINLGILQERTGRLDQAQATYRPLADDGDPLALQGIGRIYERKGNRLEAVRVYRQILALPHAEAGLKKEVKSNLVRLEE